MEKKFNIDNEFFLERINETKESYPFPSPGDKMRSCLDVGANVGAFSILFSEYCNNVIAIEPYKPNYDFMVNKINELKLDNIITYNKAISRIDGEIIEMSVADQESCSGDISTSDPKGIVHLGTAETMSYSYINENYPGITYMKVDCEGCEYDLLMGSPLKEVKILVMELHGDYIGKKKKRELLNYLGTQFKSMQARPENNEVLMFFNVDIPIKQV